MKKTVVLNVVGLTSGLIGENTPFLSKWSSHAANISIHPVLPAVTCSAQATYLTGKYPEEHGIVGNGWYFKEESEIKFWRQSNQLVQSPKIWDKARTLNPSFTCANLFWWYNMYSSVDFSVTPRPQYLADGRKIPDIYTQPADLREKLQSQLGAFPLFNFWGPNTSIKSSKWIAEAAKKVEEWHDPTLTLIYLPHLDYNFQRHGTLHQSILKDLKEIDSLCADLVHFYENEGAQVVILSEYGITNVSHPIHINRVLRKRGYIQMRTEQGLELLDAGASKVFAVADHQVAHIYINDKTEKENIFELLKNTEGIETVLDDKGKVVHHLNHSRAGDFVAIADHKSWFTYYYWLEDDKAPDFARTVDIHRKPGYDPVEMFTDPAKKMLAARVAWKLLKKKLGFRMLMDLIPLDASLIKGSHGRIPESKSDWPVLITKNTSINNKNFIEPTDVFQILLAHLQS